jgi:hypothetical protein
VKDAFNDAFGGVFEEWDDGVVENRRSWGEVDADIKGFPTFFFEHGAETMKGGIFCDN